MTKKKQLRQVIESTLQRFKVAILMHDVGLSAYTKQDSIIDSYTNTLVKEVSIRTKI